MPSWKSFAEACGRGDPKPWKATLFASSRLLVGVNCLEPGQVQPVHAHDEADKFYCVHEGRGRFVVGVESFEAGPGAVVWAPAGVPHGVTNEGPSRLSVLVGIAPAP